MSQEDGANLLAQWCAAGILTADDIVTAFGKPGAEAFNLRRLANSVETVK